MMRYLRPIPKRLMSEGMIVWPSNGDGTFAPSRLIRHVRFERADAVVDDAHRSASVSGFIYVDASTSQGSFEIPAGSRVLVGSGPSMMVRSCTRCCVLRGQVHHWKLEVG